MESFSTKQLVEENDTFAIDGSQIRILTQTQNGSMVHCRLGPGHKTKAVTHRTVDELRYYITGEGEFWRKNEATGHEEITNVKPGIAISNPVGTHFQYRNTGNEDLDCIIVVMPPWPGDDEVKEVKGKW